MAKHTTSIWVHLAGAALCSAVLAYVLLRVLQPVAGLAPAAPAHHDAAQTNPALSARLFGQTDTAGTSTGLSVVLLGAYVAGPHSAVVANLDGKHQRTFLVGQELGQGVTLTAVFPDHVVLNQNGTPRNYPLPAVAVAHPSDTPPSSFRQGKVLTAPSLDGPPATAPVLGALAQPGPAAPDNPALLNGPTPSRGMLPRAQRDDPNASALATRGPGPAQ